MSTLTDVIIYYKPDIRENIIADTEDVNELERQILSFANDGNLLAIGTNGDFCLSFGESTVPGGVEGIVEAIRRLDYVERIEIKKY